MGTTQRELIVFVVENSANDERFFDNPLATTGPHVQFYAGAPLLSPDGQPIGTVCVIDTKSRSLSQGQLSSLKSLSNQVTRLLELRTQIKKLEDTEVTLRIRNTTIETISEGVIVRDATGKLLDVNASALRILGLSKEKLFETMSDRFNWNAINEDGSPLAPYNHPAEIVLQTGRSAKKNVLGITTPKGARAWLQVSGEPIFKNNSADVLGVAVSFSDITDQIEDKRRAEQNQQELRFILDSIPHMIGYWNSDLINLNSNTAYSKYFGKNPSEIYGKHIKDLLGAEIFKKNLPYLQQVLEGKHVTFERSLPHADGTLHHTLATYIPNMAHGKVLSFLAIVMDITDLKNLGHQRQILESKLAESARLSALGEMAGGVAHEINNPLAIIRGKAGILKLRLNGNQLDLATGLKEFSAIEATVDRIAKIVKGLRTYSRNAEDDPFEDSNIKNIIDDTIALCGEKFKASSVNITLQCEQNIKLQCRPAQISQVLMNLLMNAYDAIEELNEKWIKISVTENSNDVIVMVTDCGNGIQPEVVSKMMNPFFTTKEVGKGTGLGLSISTGIAEIHGGSLKFLPLEKNTTFCLKLPKEHS